MDGWMAERLNGWLGWPASSSYEARTHCCVVVVCWEAETKRGRRLARPSRPAFACSALCSLLRDGEGAGRHHESRSGGRIQQRRRVAC